jgi:predicted nucleic acid-binding protein
MAVAHCFDSLQLKSRYGIAYWDAAVIAGAHRADDRMRWSGV